MVELLNKRHVNLEVCRYLCLDEADRMLDLGFEEELNSILGKFKVSYSSCCYCIIIILISLGSTSNFTFLSHYA